MLSPVEMDIGKSAAIGIMGPKGHWWRCGDIGGWIMNMARKCSQNGKSGGVVHVDGTNEQAGLHFLLYHSRDGR